VCTSLIDPRKCGANQSFALALNFQLLSLRTEKEIDAKQATWPTLKLAETKQTEMRRRSPKKLALMSSKARNTNQH